MDLRLQFEAMNQLTPEEKDVARAVLEVLLIKHVARKRASPAAIAEGVHAAGITPMSDEEIVAEVKAVRAERRAAKAQEPKQDS